MRPLFTLFLLLPSLAATAQHKTTSAPTTGNTPASFVPKSWKIIYTATGDLNKDGLDDQAIIIENTDPENFILNDGMGSDTLNVNPRKLLVLFKEKNTGGYKLAGANTAFIPRQDDAENTCLADPLSETGGITITKGLLGLHFQYWLSCGSWYTSNQDYLFRYQNNRFELIGYDSREFHRSSGEMSDYSINFSTGKLSHTTGGNMFEETPNKPVTTWKKFSYPRKMILDQMTDKAFDEILKIMDQK